MFFKNKRKGFGSVVSTLIMFIAINLFFKKTIDCRYLSTLTRFIKVSEFSKKDWAKNGY